MARAAKGNEQTKTSRKTSAPRTANRTRGDLEDRIRRRAYELWEAEGRPQGRDAEHWSRAEHELAQGGGATPGRAPRRDTSGAVARPRAAKKSGGSVELGGSPSSTAVGRGRQTRSSTTKKM